MTCMERLIRVTKDDGHDLMLPAGDPSYGRSKRQSADDGEGDRLLSIAREISRKIRDAKASAESELRPKL